MIFSHALGYKIWEERFHPDIPENVFPYLASWLSLSRSEPNCIGKRDFHKPFDEFHSILVPTDEDLATIYYEVSKNIERELDPKPFVSRPPKRFDHYSLIVLSERGFPQEAS